MSEPEDERLRAARIKAALAFFGPKQATMREALEGAGFALEYSARYQQRVVVLRCPGKYDLAGNRRVLFRCAMSARSCSLWLLGLPEEWEVSEGGYERARERLLAEAIPPEDRPGHPKAVMRGLQEIAEIIGVEGQRRLLDSVRPCEKCGRPANRCECDEAIDKARARAEAAEARIAELEAEQ